MIAAMMIASRSPPVVPPTVAVVVPAFASEPSDKIAIGRAGASVFAALHIGIGPIAGSVSLRAVENGGLVCVSVGPGLTVSLAEGLPVAVGVGLVVSLAEGLRATVGVGLLLPVGVLVSVSFGDLVRAGGIGVGTSTHIGDVTTVPVFMAQFDVPKVAPVLPVKLNVSK
jgi:hypothetical protein